MISYTSANKEHSLLQITMGCKSTVIVVLILCCTGELYSVPANSRLKQLLNKMLHAIEKIIDFFEEDVSVNLDGLYGIRVFQGAIIQALGDCRQAKSQCPRHLIAAMENFNFRTTEIGNKALPYIEAKSPEYLYHFRQIVDKPFVISSSPQRIGDSKVQPGELSVYNGDFGDICVAKLCGTFSDAERKCTISKDCWLYMTSKGTARYVTTHQTLYFIWGEHVGCLPELDKQAEENGTSVRAIKRRLCKQILTEALSEEKDGNVHRNDQDLFLEQIMVCGMLGFEDFLSEEWIEMIIRWQTSRGCYSYNTESNYSFDDENLNSNLPAGNWPRRKILTEQLMTGDCLSHKTGLAIGSFGVILRYLIKIMYLQV